MEIRTVETHELRQHAQDLKKSGFRLMLVSGVDWVEKHGTFEVLYHFSQFGSAEDLVLKISVPSNDPRVPTLADVFGLADWHERETFDLFGIIFEGHPTLARIFLPDDFNGHPLRKDYPAFTRELPG